MSPHPHLLHGLAVGGDGLLLSDDPHISATIFVAVDELSLHRRRIIQQIHSRFGTSSNS